MPHSAGFQKETIHFVKGTKRFVSLKWSSVIIFNRKHSTHVTMWMNLQNIILSNGSQAQKIEHCMIRFVLNIPNT